MCVCSTPGTVLCAFQVWTHLILSMNCEAEPLENCTLIIALSQQRKDKTLSLMKSRGDSKSGSLNPESDDFLWTMLLVTVPWKGLGCSEEATH